MKTKVVTSIIAILLSCVLFTLPFMVNNNTNDSIIAQASIRTVSYSNEFLDSQNIFEEFENVSITTEGTKTVFAGTRKLETSCLSDTDLIAIEKNFGQEFFIVKYELKLDSNTLNVELSIGFTFEDGEIVTDTMNGTLIQNANGQSDAMFFIDNEAVLLSEICDINVYDEIGFFSNLWNCIKNVVNKIVNILTEPLKVVIIALTPCVKLLGGVIAIVIVPFTISQSNSNYSKNTSSSRSVSVNGAGYITNQSTTEFSNWKMGSKSIKQNGCGAIATFNALVFAEKIVNDASKVQDNDLGKYRRTCLANIIRSYELGAGTLIDGVLGINPDAITPLLIGYGVKVQTYTKLAGNLGFEFACDNLKTTQMALLCYWWSSSGNVGAHYIAITKSNNQYTIYNDNFTLQTSISEFLHGNQTSNGFIQGWIVTK